MITMICYHDALHNGDYKLSCLVASIRVHMLRGIVDDQVILFIFSGVYTDIVR